MNMKKIIPDQHLLHSQEVAEMEFLGQLNINNEPVKYLVGKLPVV